MYKVTWEKLKTGFVVPHAMTDLVTSSVLWRVCNLNKHCLIVVSQILPCLKSFHLAPSIAHARAKHTLFCWPIHLICKSWEAGRCHEGWRIWYKRARWLWGREHQILHFLYSFFISWFRVCGFFLLQVTSWTVSGSVLSGFVRALSGVCWVFHYSTQWHQWNPCYLKQAPLLPRKHKGKLIGISSRIGIRILELEAASDC